MRKLYTFLLMLITLTVSMSLKAQYSVNLTSAPDNNYAWTTQSFSLQEVAGTLGIEKAELYDALRYWGNDYAFFALRGSVDEFDGNYTGAGQEFWLDISGNKTSYSTYSDGNNVWFVGMEYNEEEITFHVGQRPNYFDPIFTDTDLKVRAYLVLQTSIYDEWGYWQGYDYKAVSFDINYHINAPEYKALTINVTNPGTLGRLILQQTENLSDVNGLTITGSLNSEDMELIKNDLTRLADIDLTETDLTEIPSSLFSNSNYLTSIKLPKGLTTIGSSAFYGCTRLTEIEFPEGLSTIGNSALAHTGLTRIDIPSSVRLIDQQAFGYCTQLAEVNFAQGLETIEEHAFAGCKKLQSIVFPSTLKTIGGCAFYLCSSLSEVQFAEGLTILGYESFSQTPLTSVTLPSTLQSIYSSFENCEKLTTVTCKALTPPTAMYGNYPVGGTEQTCDLYVPNVTVIDYKLTEGWKDFSIHGADMMPENITVTKDLTLNINSDFANVKPNVNIVAQVENTASGHIEYGSLTTEGSETLSMGTFITYADPNYSRAFSHLGKTDATLINNATMRADHVQTTIWIPSDQWTFVSFPYDVKASDIQQIKDAYSGTQWVIRKYDGQKRADGNMDETWVNMGEDDILEAHQGYIWQMEGRRDANGYRVDYGGFDVPAINNANKNNIFANDDVEIALAGYPAEFEHNRSWNLIGNPYPCYYDTRFMDFTAPITVWNLNNQQYEAYSPIDDEYVLSPNEAFFVQCPIDKENIVFSKEGRMHTYTPTNSDIYAKVRDISATPRLVFNFTLSDGVNSDRTRVVINNDAQTAYEIDKDASKFMSTSANAPQIFSINNDVRYAINERPLDSGDVALGMTLTSDGIYTISMQSNSANTVVLEDTQTGESTGLNDTDYSFSAKAGTTDSRFILHFFDSEATAINTVKEKEGTDGSALYTLDGRRVTTSTTGIYLMKKGQKFQKVFIK
ncbi:MAG: leucine-rich repeat protein [Bacteroidaceae bacterium]|nr:leucine-rich repeat protein [Bacteroidaceae bacterium]